MGATLRRLLPLISDLALAWGILDLLDSLKGSSLSFFLACVVHPRRAEVWAMGASVCAQLNPLLTDTVEL